MKITTAAAASIKTGIKNAIATRSSGGHICQDGFVECNDGRVLEVFWDKSYPSAEQIRYAKIVRKSWHSAMMDAVNS